MGRMKEPPTFYFNNGRDDLVAEPEKTPRRIDAGVST